MHLKWEHIGQSRKMQKSQRNAKASEIGDEMAVSFAVENSRFVFSNGDIIAIKDGEIVEKKSIADFNKRPAQVFRMLQYSILMEK